MIPEEQQELATLYVLGSLDPNETAEFEAAMRKDAELRALVNELGESAGALAFAAPVEKSRGAGSSARSTTWLPWAIAAMLMIFSGFLVYDRMQLRRELNELRAQEPLTGMNFVAMAPQKGAPADAKAIVAWDPAEQTGVIRITGLPAVSGRDYQLWAVDADHKDPVSAGILHVDANGVASVRFKPVAEARHVKAFAISLERKGGAAKAQGPILLVGSTT